MLMKNNGRQTKSMARRFTRGYLFISLIPLCLLFICTVIGASLAQHHIAALIHRSTNELGNDARLQLEDLGRKIIQSQAKDVAKQIEIFLKYHPDAEMKDLQNNPYFKDLAMQKVGKTGYTCLYEAGTGIMRIHPNPRLVDSDMRSLSKLLPTWWAIFEPSLSGIEISGYYDWLEPNEKIRPKYMTMTPVKLNFQGKTLMIAATTYIDEFSEPITTTLNNAQEISTHYRKYIVQQGWLIVSVTTAILLITYACVYFLGRRSALRYILPIVDLAQAAKRVGSGEWEIDENTAILNREDEIGDLARTFKVMRLKLKDLFSNLEARLAELKSTQQALKKSEEHYRSLFDDVPVGLYRTEPDGRIIDSNPTLVRMLGYPDKETFLSHPATAMYTDPKDRLRWKMGVESKRKENLHETQMRRYDGSVIWVDNYSIAVRDDKGKILHYEGSLKDITERKAAETALQKSNEKYRELYEETKRAEELYRSLLHSSADAIVIYDLEGRTKYVSPVFTELFGWSLSDVEGKRIPFLPDTEKNATMAIINDIVQDGIPCHGHEGQRYTKDGSLIEVSISASRFQDHDEKPAGLLVILRDITERKKLEVQIHNIQRMEAIGTLAGGIAHDFNNLMMGIIGNVSLMMLDMDTVNPLYPKLKSIENLIQSGSKLTSQLLGYARKGKYEIKSLDFNQIVRDTRETFARTKKEIVIHQKLSRGVIAIDADRSQIEQVLFNLYVNAADAMPQGGDLTIKTLILTDREMENKPYKPPPGDYAMLEITDTGTGMDLETQTRIFDPFFTTKEMGKGTGLGLASVYGIIKAHGGYIDVESKKEHGSVFRIYLRVSAKGIETTPRRISVITRGVGTILLVDDEETVLDIGVQMIEKMGYSVLAAKSGEEALAIYNKNASRIDLVILDLIMPGMSGTETFDELKKIDPDIKTLLSSGYSIDGQAMEVLDRGCNGFIQKPYNLGFLSKEINKILGKR